MSPPHDAGAAAAQQAPASASRFQDLFKGAAEECNLPPFPAAAAKAVALTRDPKAKVEDVGRAVSHDAALAARVLRLSRSAAFMTLQPPKTLQDAIRMVGLERVRQLLVTASARSLHPAAASDPFGKGLWNHALATALAADELGYRAGKPRGGQGFMAGLLHDIGKLVFYLSDKASCAGLGFWDEAREKELFGTSHAVVGGALAFRWQLDPAIADAIVEHHARPLPKGLAGELARADWIAHRIGHGSSAEPIEAIEPPDADVVYLEAIAEQVAKTFDSESEAFA